MGSRTVHFCDVCVRLPGATAGLLRLELRVPNQSRGAEPIAIDLCAENDRGCHDRGIALLLAKYRKEPMQRE